MSYSINILYEHKILYYQHYGTIKRNNIIESWEKVLTLLEKQGYEYNLLLDFRNAHFIFKPGEIDAIVDFFYATTDMLHGKRIAGIAQISHEAAIIKLIETLKCEKDDFHVRLFITFEEALCFLS